MKIYVRDGQSSNAWTHAVEVIDDMINLIEMPDKSKDDKYFFNLKQRLIFGMNIIPLSAVKRDDFMQDLTNYFQKNKEGESHTLKDNHNVPDLIYKNGTDANDISEDVTAPNPNIKAFITGSNIPFMSELLVDLKK